MRVLHLVTTLHAGGIASSLASSLPELHRPPEVLVEVACLERTGHFATILKRAGVPVHDLGAGRRYDPQAVLALVRLVRSHRFDLVHVHGWPAFFFAVGVCRSLGVPLITSEHNVSNNRRRPWFRPVDRRLYASCAAVVAVSEAVAESLGQWLPEVRSRTRVVANGVDVAALAEGGSEGDPAAGSSAETPTILAPGGLSRKKGVDVLLEAARSLGGEGFAARILIAGSGPEEAELRQQASTSMGAVEIEFLGWRDDLASWMRRTDLVVLPSRREGCPMAILEAMACGTPVVASDVGGVGELLDGGRAGWLVPPEDPRRLADAVREALTSPDQRTIRARRATERVVRLFTARRAARGLEGVYREVLGREADERPDAAATLLRVPQTPPGKALVTALSHYAGELASRSTGTSQGSGASEPWDGLLERPEAQPFRPAIVWAARRLFPQVRESPDLVAEESETAVRELVESQFLEELLPLLEHAGIRAIALKGMVWRATLYPEPSARRMGDLDLLVPLEDSERVVALLQERGFSAEEGALVEEDLETSSKGIVMLTRRHPAPVGIDLHWRLVNLRWLRAVFRLDDLDLRARSEVMTLGVSEVLALSLEDQVLHLAYHQAVKHHLLSTQGFLDLDLLLRLRDPDFAELARRARRAGLRTALWWSLTATVARFGTPIGSRWTNDLRPGRIRVWATRSLLDLREDAFGPRRFVGPSRSFLLALLMSDGIGGLLRGLWAGLWPSREWLEGRARRAGVRTSWLRSWHWLRLLGRLVRRQRDRDKPGAA